MSYIKEDVGNGFKVGYNNEDSAATNFVKGFRSITEKQERHKYNVKKTLFNCKEYDFRAIHVFDGWVEKDKWPTTCMLHSCWYMLLERNGKEYDGECGEYFAIVKNLYNTHDCCAFIFIITKVEQSVFGHWKYEGSLSNILELPQMEK